MRGYWESARGNLQEIVTRQDKRRKEKCIGTYRKKRQTSKHVEKRCQTGNRTKKLEGKHVKRDSKRIVPLANPLDFQSTYRIMNPEQSILGDLLLGLPFPISNVSCWNLDSDYL